MRIAELFRSFNGEICHAHQGSLAVFVRLYGCNCRCLYCDTKRSYEGNMFIEMPPEEIVDKVVKYGISNVTITGGEPLCQELELMDLVDRLDAIDIVPSIETNGSIPIPLTTKATWVADYKLPSSGMEHMMNPKENYHELEHCDCVKFVISDEADFERAEEVMHIIDDHTLVSTFAFSPAWGKMKASDLANMILGLRHVDHLNIVYSLQLHKLLKIL